MTRSTIAASRKGPLGKDVAEDKRRVDSQVWAARINRLDRDSKSFSRCIPYGFAVSDSDNSHVMLSLGIESPRNTVRHFCAFIQYCNLYLIPVSFEFHRTNCFTIALGNNGRSSAV